MQLCEKLTTETINGQGKYMNGERKTWKEPIKTIFHDQDILYDMCCIATVVLKAYSVYKQGNTSISRYLFKNINTLMQKASNAIVVKEA